MRTDFALFAIALAGLLTQADRPQQFEVANTTVTVTSTQEVTANKRNTWYQVKLRFRSNDGPNRGADLIGVGPLVGEGVVTLLVEKPKLAFRTAGASPTEISVTVTGSAAGEGFESPEPGDFVAANTYDCNCADENALFSRVLTTLDAYFFEGVRPYTVSPPHRLVSTFHQLDDLPSGVLGKVAIMIEYPVAAPDKKVGFRLGWIARESRAQSRATWIPAQHKEVIAKATDYVRRVVARLRGTAP